MLGEFVMRSRYEALWTGEPSYLRDSEATSENGKHGGSSGERCAESLFGFECGVVRPLLGISIERDRDIDLERAYLAALNGERALLARIDTELSVRFGECVIERGEHNRCLGVGRSGRTYAVPKRAGASVAPEDLAVERRFRR